MHGAEGLSDRPGRRKGRGRRCCRSLQELRTHVADAEKGRYGLAGRDGLDTELTWLSQKNVPRDGLQHRARRGGRPQAVTPARHAAIDGHGAELSHLTAEPPAVTSGRPQAVALAYNQPAGDAEQVF